MANREEEDGATLPLTALPPCAGGVSRRSFCASAGLGLIAIGLPACGVGDSRIRLGALDGQEDPNGGGDDEGTHGGGSPDLGSTGPEDLGGTTPPDLAKGGNTCSTSGVLNAGASSAIAAGSAKHFTDNFHYDLFVCRDSGGLYALSASCTHSGCTVSKQSSQFYCPCHGATFDLNGQHPTSPAFSPLEHYAICVDASGTIYVNYNNVVGASTRY